SFYIAMEYCPYGDLRMCCMTALPESYAKSIVKQVAKGLVFLHSSDILHRDVKPDNILVAKGPPIDTTIAVKIADFGVAKKVNSEQVEGTRANSHAGTNGFMAPEVHMGAGDDYTFSCDIWSLGCVQFWLLTLAEKIPQNLKFKQILEEKGVSTEAVNFCLSLTEYHPGRRPTASEVLEDAWLRGFTEVPITDRAQKAFMVGQGRKRSIMSQVECK
ncbi:kinase-like protein, partial [Ascobolus immersus RN42]